MKELPIRIIETDEKAYIEIPTEGWNLARRWDWIKSLVTGGDILVWPRQIQHVNLRTPKLPQEAIYTNGHDDSKHMM